MHILDMPNMGLWGSKHMVHGAWGTPDGLEHILGCPKDAWWPHGGQEGATWCVGLPKKCALAMYKRVMPE